jgi:glucose/arabinose dehydrogenase
MGKSLFFLCACFCSILCFAQQPKDFIIPVKIKVDPSVPSVIIQWDANADARSYTIKRKKVTDSSFTQSFTTIAQIDNSVSVSTYFEDINVEQGMLYEYEVSGNFAVSLPALRSTYICAGIDVPAVHYRGHILLLCDSSLTTEINGALDTLYKDLAGDGWKVIRRDVERNNTPVNVKNKILDVYNNITDLKQVLIVGHVPVPYSGNIDPDGHTDHNGSWPADGYYGNITGNWTDTISYLFLIGQRPETINQSGDGKFDQSYLPSVQLAVGRIDFSNLPSFEISEAGLIRKYIQKNYKFKHTVIQPIKRALVEDNFLSFAEKFSQSAWKSYSALVGYDNITVGQYETDLLDQNGYLWSYGNGGGTYTGAGGIGNTSDFVIRTYRTVFTQLFGSYFGDWDNQDNFLRSSLASGGYTLTAVWGGRPHWFFHHMSAGLPMGYAELLTMNNGGIYTNTGYGPTMVHMGLMGDPSLRSNYIKPPQAFSAQTNQAKIDLQWTGANETNVAGYYLYRSNSVTGNFTRLNNEPITELHFTDFTPLNGNNVYMIRTAKMDTIVTLGNYTNNSTYLNLSVGLFDSAVIAAPTIFLEQIFQAASPKQVVIMGDSSKRYFIGQKNGDVKLYNDRLIFIDTYLSVPGANEGFFSIAFDPGFESNKLLYAFYTNANGDLELSRFKESISADTALPDGVMLTIPNPGASKNLGGEIHFGPGGYLYISTGDGDTKNAASNNAQNNQSLLGKILRIMPPAAASPASAYTIPPDNPYNNEVFASGLRFPLRWEFDKLTNDIWIGDRGDSSIEEINNLSFSSLKGANFGWPCYEGNNTFNNNSCGISGNNQFPVYQYASPGNGSSVTGGTIYHGETFFALKGYYIFADANNNKIYLSRFDSLTQTYNTVSQILSPGAISDISEDSNGELYATSLLGGVYRIGASGPRRYRFFGNRNWNNSNNWSNKAIPPALLPAGSEIIVSPALGGECILNVPQTISASSKIIVENNRRFTIMGNLTIQ